MIKCNKCGSEKELSEFHKNKTCRFGVIKTCKQCMVDYTARYYQQNKSRIKTRVKIYRSVNKDSYNAYKKAYRSVNKDYYKAYMSKHCKNLYDSYIKSQLKKSGIINPTTQMIIEKREVIKLKRLLHEKQRAINSPRNHVSII